MASRIIAFLLGVSANGVNWIFTLVTSVAFSFVGIVVPNLYNQTKKPRSHNREKFINEFLARHQLTYITFLLAVTMTGEFKPGFDWEKKLSAFVIALALSSYFIGVYFTIHQDNLFIDHGCIDVAHCPKPISKAEMFKLVKSNLFTAISFFFLAIFISLSIK